MRVEGGATGTTSFGMLHWHRIFLQMKLPMKLPQPTCQQPHRGMLPRQSGATCCTAGSLTCCGSHLTRTLAQRVPAHLLHCGASHAGVRVNTRVASARRIPGVAVRAGGPIVRIPFMARGHLQSMGIGRGGCTRLCTEWY